MTILSDLLLTAERFDKWQQVQEASKDPAVAQHMEQARVNFNGPRYLPLDDHVFFEEIVEDDDLMPIRYFEMGCPSASGTSWPGSRAMPCRSAPTCSTSRTTSRRQASSRSTWSSRRR